MRRSALMFAVLVLLSCNASPRSGSSGDGAPLFVWLHGFTPTGDVYRAPVEARMRALAEAEGWRFIAPEGFTGPEGEIYWPASPACCDRFHEGHDGVGRVWAAIQAEQPEGPIFIVGLSNGGFMAHRMACELPGEITAAVSISGAGTCALEIHGTLDAVVPFDGGPVRGMGLPPAPPASAAPDLWSGDWGHAGTPQDLIFAMIDYLEAHERADRSK